MTINETSWRNLGDRDERTVARIARIAINNTVIGGASALVYAKRLLNMGGQNVLHVVGDVYSMSSGRPHSDYSAFACPECGSAHLGRDAAAQCCMLNADDTID